MPRPRKTASPDPDALALGLDPDPIPGAPARRGPGRPRKVTTAPATRGPGKIPARDGAGRIQSKTALVKQLTDELEMYLTIANATWMLRDPDCAVAAEEAIPEVAARTAALIGRNERLLATMAKTGIVGDIVKLAAALLPVVRVVWAAHGPGGTGHKLEEFDASRYPAHTG